MTVMMTEKEVRERLDATVNRLTRHRELFAKDPRGPQAAALFELALISRIKTLEEVLGIGAWDEKEIPKNLKLDKRKWS
jgi:hypothetical protein